MAVAGNQSDFDNIEFDLQGAIQLHCSFEKNYNDDICLVHRLSPEVTYDDVDYIVNKSHHSLSFNITGLYVPCVFIALGVIGNVICLSILCCKRRNTPYGTYISYLIILNLIYLLSGSLAQALQVGRYTELILSYHYLSCMLWPPLLELITHLTMWLIAMLTLHTVKSRNDKRGEVYQFQARLQCLAVTVTVIFLNYHSTLLRELVIPSMRCSISPKSGSFYRYAWPWIKASVGVYIPCIISAACSIITCCRTSDSPRCKLKQAVIVITVWYISVTAINRMILQPYEYSQMTTNEEFSDHVINLQIYRELFSTVQHALASVPIAVAVAFHELSQPSSAGK